MEFLRNIFKEQISAEIDGEGNVSIGESVFSPVNILSADPTAFDDEFLKWRNDEWLPEQELWLAEILTLHDNQKRFTDLCAAHKNGEIVPLIGSGMSAPSGLTTWSNFLRSIQKDSKMIEADLEALLQSSSFEEAVDKLRVSMPPRLFDNRVEHDLRIDDAKSIIGPVVVLPELFGKLILTTNLDNLLEALYRKRNISFSHELHGSSMADYRTLKAASERVLLKFHGDCRSSKGRVLGSHEYDTAYAAGSPIREELSIIYKTKSLLCLGCSLGPDRTVQLIAEVAKSDPSMPKHYTFAQKPSEESDRIDREHFLTDRGIYPIWYNEDHNECLLALLVGMLKHMGKL